VSLPLSVLFIRSESSIPLEPSLGKGNGRLFELKGARAQGALAKVPTAPDE
jgi:hypothetical protein